jgi:hypothetical protein
VRSYMLVYKERIAGYSVSSSSTGAQYRAPVDNLFTSKRKLSSEITRRACMTQKLVLPCCKRTEFVYKKHTNVVQSTLVIIYYI